MLFLGTARPTTATAAPAIKPPHIVTPITKPPDKPSGPGAGFMNSYLKFLQGERDSSPPPASRGNRKQTWSRAANAKPVQPQSDVKPPDTNGVQPPAAPPPVPVTRLVF